MQQRSPQHVCFAPQQWSPQHFSFLPQQSALPQQVVPFAQHFSPQHVVVFGQQWPLQHLSLGPQHSRPQVVLPRGQLQTPATHCLSGGQQRPAQQPSAARQQVMRLSLAQHFGVVPPQHRAGVPGVPGPPGALNWMHAFSPLLQQSERLWSTHDSPALQHFWPHCSPSQIGTQLSPFGPGPHFVPGGQHAFSHGGPPACPGNRQHVSSGKQQSR